MSFISDMFGLGSNNSGTDFTAKSADILQPATLNQVASSYDRARSGLNYQQDFLAALQGLNGIQNQGSVFNQQQGLANQLQDLASGNGPNPALAQLANTTAQNVANQTALMAGQRGAGANPALLARLAASQGANTQQQAAGQAAVLRAQQQLAGINALQNQQGQMANLANTQVANQANASNTYGQATQAEQNQLLNSIANLNNARVAMQSNMNTADSNVQAGVAQKQGDFMAGGIGGIASAFGLAKGGMVPANCYADGGMTTPMAPPFSLDVTPVQGPSISAPQSYFTKYMTDYAGSNPITAAVDKLYQASNGGMDPTYGYGKQAGQALGKGIVKVATSLFGLNEGGEVGESAIEKLRKKVPGKAAVKGDSVQNDTVPAMLSPGEIVIPRSIVNSENAPEKAAQFVAQVLRNHARKGA